MPTVNLTNTDPGPRGFYGPAGLVSLDPKQSSGPVDLSDDQLQNARDAGYFEIEVTGDAAISRDPDDPTAAFDLLSVAELTAKLAEQGIPAPETGSGQGGRVLKADLVAALVAGKPDSGDGLDHLEMDALRDAVAAITGSEPDADATREQLLAAARG